AGLTFEAPVVVEGIAGGRKHRPAEFEIVTLVEVGAENAADRADLTRDVKILNLIEPALEPNVPTVEVNGLSVARKCGNRHGSKQNRLRSHASHEIPPSQTRVMKARASPNSARASLIGAR